MLICIYTFAHIYICTPVSMYICTWQHDDFKSNSPIPLDLWILRQVQIVFKSQQPPEQAEAAGAQDIARDPTQ